MAAYGFFGRMTASSSSLLNPPPGSGTTPVGSYIDPVEENSIRRTPATRTAFSTAIVPPTLTSQYKSGRATDSATSILAAKCSTPSKPESGVSTWPTWCTGSRWNSTPAGIVSAKPVDRSSSTTTWWPAPARACVTTPPMYPAPPVTSSFTYAP